VTADFSEEAGSTKYETDYLFGTARLWASLFLAPVNSQQSPVSSQKGE
jgi:hypothetical protein